MLGKMFGRKSDKAIIHQTVPEEVLYPEGKPKPPKVEDQSWMDTSGGKSNPAPDDAPGEPAATPEPAPVAAAPAPRPAAAPARQPAAPPAAPATASTEISPVELDALFSSTPNPSDEGRPKFPHGWLVVVEGPGTGEWFLLQDGVTHIGASDGQTVKLDFGDISVAPAGHAALTFDENASGFVITRPRARRCA